MPYLVKTFWVEQDEELQSWLNSLLEAYHEVVEVVSVTPIVNDDGSMLNVIVLAE